MALFWASARLDLGNKPEDSVNVTEKLSESIQSSISWQDFSAGSDPENPGLKKIKPDQTRPSGIED